MGEGSGFERWFDKEGAERRVELRFDAVDDWTRQVGELLGDGWFERPPVLRLVRPDAPPVDVQLPSFRGWAFSSRVGGPGCEPAAFGEVLRAFQDALRTHLRDGYAWEGVPAWPGSYAPPPADRYEEVDEVEGAGRHRFFRSRTDPGDELGPEWRTGGEVESFGYQVATTGVGPAVGYRGGRLAQVKSLDGGAERGAFRFLFAEDGSLVQVAVFGAEAKSVMLATWKDGTFAFSRGGTTTWVDPAGTLLRRAVQRAASIDRVTEFFPDGRTPREEGRCTKDGVRFGTWTSFAADGSPRGTEVVRPVVPPKEGTDAENHVLRLYRAPGVTERILWRRLDGTREIDQRYDEDEVLCCVLVFDEAGNPNTERTLDPGGTWTQRGFRSDGTLWKERSLSASRAPLSEWRDVAARPLDGAQIVDAAFRCLEDDTFLHAPCPGARFEGVGFATGRLQELETHLARIYLLAAMDEPGTLLRPHLQDGPVPERSWFRGDRPAKPRPLTFASDAGSTLEVGFVGSRTASIVLQRADGSVGGSLRRDLDAIDQVVVAEVESRGARRRGSLRVSGPGLEPTELWTEYDREGRLSRAYDATYRTDWIYDAAFRAPPAEASSWGDAAAVADRLLDSPPSRSAFVELCGHARRAALHDPDRFCAELVPRWASHLAAWPSSVRCAPTLWIVHLVVGHLPVEALRLCSALTLTAAIGTHHWKNRLHPLLLDWLDRYPEDGPALEGVGASLRETAKLAVAEARDREPEERLRPDVDVYDGVHAWRTDGLVRALRSPLFRRVRVLDLSLDDVGDELGPDSSHAHREEALAGRGLDLFRALEVLESEELEVLDVHGTVLDWDARGRPVRPRPSLRALDLGGARSVAGAPASLGALLKAFPGLVALDLGRCADLRVGDEPAAPVDTKKLGGLLAGLRHLARLTTDEPVPLPKGSAVVRSDARLELPAPLAAWHDHFE